MKIEYVITILVVIQGFIILYIKKVIENSVANKFKKELEAYKKDLEIDKERKKVIDQESYEAVKTLVQNIYRLRNSYRDIIEGITTRQNSEILDYLKDQFPGHVFLPPNDFFKLPRYNNFLDESDPNKEIVEALYKNKLVLTESLFALFHEIKNELTSFRNFGYLFMDKLNAGMGDVEIKEEIVKYTKRYNRLDFLYKEVVISAKRNWNI